MTLPYYLKSFLRQAEEFVGGVAKDELESVVAQAAGACPGHTLALLVEGLDHYLTLRQRREFQVPQQLPEARQGREWGKSGDAGALTGLG